MWIVKRSLGSSLRSVHSILSLLFSHSLRHLANFASKQYFGLLFIVTLGLFTTDPARGAMNEESDLLGYDSIVNQLNRESDRSTVSRARLSAASAPDALDSIWFHGGVGISTYMETLNLENGSSLFIGQKGISVSGGIDLFSPNWIAEGTIRNFGETEDSPTHVGLKEFDLKVFFHDQFSRRIGFHVGGGLSARYMTIRRTGQSILEYTTPTSIAAVGLDYFFSDRISVGIEGAARNSMITETIDRDSYDATLRVDLQL